MCPSGVVSCDVKSGDVIYGDDQESDHLCMTLSVGLTLILTYSCLFHHEKSPSSQRVRSD